jgi:hypothetical protein
MPSYCLNVLEVVVTHCDVKKVWNLYLEASIKGNKPSKQNPTGLVSFSDERYVLFCTLCSVRLSKRPPFVIHYSLGNATRFLLFLYLFLFI